MSRSPTLVWASRPSWHRWFQPITWDPKRWSQWFSMTSHGCHHFRCRWHRSRWRRGTRAFVVQLLLQEMPWNCWMILGVLHDVKRKKIYYIHIYIYIYIWYNIFPYVSFHEYILSLRLWGYSNGNELFYCSLYDLIWQTFTPNRALEKTWEDIRVADFDDHWTWLHSSWYWR